MKVKLAYRAMENIAVHPMYNGLYDPSAVKRLRAQSKIIRDAVPVVIDNVARYYAESPRQEWSFDSIPNWAPPFKHAFFEWEMPPRWNFGDGLTEAPFPAGIQAGFQVMSLPVKDRNPLMWKRLFGAFIGATEVDDRFEQVSSPALDKAKWVLSADLFMSAPVKPMCGRCCIMGYTTFIFVAEDGSYLERVSSGIAFHLGERASHFDDNLRILGLAISFMHCKNVIQDESDYSPGRRWHAATKVPKVTFRTLRIGDETHRSAGAGGETGEHRALHICRGHFATYTKEKPLFGKYVGTFWRPDHTRGTSERGVIEKDYEVAGVGH